MKILYDYQIFSIQKYGGATKYFCELMKNIPPKDQFNLSLIVSDNHYLKENSAFFKKFNILSGKNFKGKSFIQKNLFAVNRYYSGYCISKNDFDIFHPTYYDNYFFNKLKKPYIITVHDLILYKFGDLYKSHPGKLPMENAIKKATRIIAISENTKTDLIEILHINPEKIDVVHHGYNEPKPGSISQASAKYGKYILFIGRRSLYKNFALFAQAVSKLLTREKDIKLVCIGPPFTEAEKASLSGLGILNQAVAINVDDDSLNDLYNGALVFVYPSLYEGFGMPILEAFANNCPVCLSNASCFPEIAGNAGIYFDPNDQESILKAMEKIIYDSDFAKEMIKKGKMRLAGFSWEKTAKETISSYNKAIGGTN